MAMTKSFVANVEFEGSFAYEPPASLIGTIKAVADKAIGAQLKMSGWRVGTPTIESEGDNKYKLTIPWRRVGKRKFESEGAEDQAKQIVARVFTGHGASKMVAWKPIGSFTGIGQPESDKEGYIAPEDMLVFPDNYMDFFEGIFERETQIKRILNSIRIARESRMRVRDHILLYGEPACGKTTLCIATKEMLDIHMGVQRFDATDTTKAGAVQSLMDAIPKPALIIIEEIEKVQENQIPFLLALMDGRAELRKVTSKTDRTERIPALVIATVNDVARLKSVYSGAIYSRFGNRIYCPLPSESLVKKVLLDQVQDIPGGRLDWVAPAIEYAKEEGSMRDIRRIKSILTAGGNDLLTGEYQREQRKLREQEKADVDLVSSINRSEVRVS